MWRVIGPNGVVVRAGYSLDSEALGTLEKGAVVERIRSDGNRMEVRGQGKKGWVTVRRDRDGMLLMEPATAPQAPPSPRVVKHPNDAPGSSRRSGRSSPRRVSREDSSVSSVGRRKQSYHRSLSAGSDSPRVVRAKHHATSHDEDEQATYEYINGTDYVRNQTVYTTAPILVNGVPAVCQGAKGVVVGPSTNPRKPDRISVVFQSELYNVNPESISDVPLSAAAHRRAHPSGITTPSAASAYPTRGYPSGASYPAATRPVSVPVLPLVDSTQPVFNSARRGGGGSPAAGSPNRIVQSLIAKRDAGVIDDYACEEALHSVLGDQYDSVPRAPPSYVATPASPAAAVSVPPSMRRRIDDLRTRDPKKHAMFRAVSASYLNNDMTAAEYRASLQTILE